MQGNLTETYQSARDYWRADKAYQKLVKAGLAPPRKLGRPKTKPAQAAPAQGEWLTGPAAVETLKGKKKTL